MKLIYRKQPTRTCCGQTCVSMVTGKSLDEVFKLFGHKRTTDHYERSKVIEKLGCIISDGVPVSKVSDLPETALVRLAFPKKRGKGLKKTGHIVLFHKGMFYDPTLGISKAPLCGVLHMSYEVITPEPLESVLANPEDVQ